MICILRNQCLLLLAVNRIVLATQIQNEEQVDGLSKGIHWFTFFN
jgi:hypothetical protein